MTDKQKEKEFYDRLQIQLEQDTTWPSPYLFKFIVPSSLEKIAAIEAIFNGLGAKIKTKDSSKGTYTSVSVQVEMQSPETVIKKYLEVSKVEGVISL